LDSIEQLSSRDHKIHKQASTYVKEQYYSTSKELDFFFQHHSRIKRELKERNTSFWERDAISIFSTFEQSAKKGNSMSPIFRQVLDEYNFIAESTLKKQTYGDDWLSYKLSRLKGFCGANNPDEKNFEQYVQYIVAIQTHSGIDSRGAKGAWSILKKDFPLAGTLFNQLIDWQIKNLEKNWTEKDSSTLELRIKELYAEKLGAAVHSYKPKISTEQEISVSYAWYATQIDSIETLIGANRSLFEKANLQLSKELFEQLDYSSLGLEDNMIRILVTTEWPITVERGRFWNALGAYFSTIEKYPLKKDWLGNQIQKNRVEHDKKIILHIKKQSKEAPIVFSKYWSKYFQLKIKSILNTEGSNEKTIAIFKNYLEEAESYFGLESALYVEFWDLIYYHTSHSIATKKMFLNWRIDRIKAYEKALYTNIPSPLLSQVAAEEIFHKIRIPTSSNQKHPMQPVDFDWYMIRLDSIVKHVGNKHWLTKKAWQRISIEFEEEHKYNLILKKWHFNTILDPAKTNLENLSPENKLIKADILLYGLTHCSPNKENPSLDYDWHNLQLDSIETLVGMQGNRFNKAWNVVSSRYITDKAAKRRFLQLYLNKAEAISGFIDSPEAMFIIYSVVEFYKTESTSDEDLTKKLYVFRSKIAKHAPCSSDLELEETFMIVEQMPRFYGCEDIEGDNRTKKECADKLMLDFIYSNLNYPQLAKDNQIEGMAVINFTVTPCGTLTKLKILRDPGGGCGKEALRIMESMNYLLNKPWIAGKQRGRKVYVRYNLPIRFKLEKN
jgi:TonB family protein